MTRGKLSFWGAAILGSLLDWWSKGAAFAYHVAEQGGAAHRHQLQVYATDIVSLELVREYNRGMAFGLMQNTAHAPLFLAIARGCAVIVILCILRRTPRHALVQKLSLGTLAAGALGNLADNLFNHDRGHEHAVRDFIHITGPTWSFPAFNLADACVTIGGASYLLSLLLRRR